MSAPVGQPPAAYANGDSAPTLPIVGPGVVGLAFASQITFNSTTEPVFFRPYILAKVQRRIVAERFALAVRNLRGVEEVWLDPSSPDLSVSVVMRDLDFDRELELRGIFIDLVCEAFDPSVGELSVYAVSEEVPDFVREDERLA